MGIQNGISSLYVFVRRRLALNVAVVTIVMFSISWTECNVPSSVGVATVQVMMILPCAGVILGSMLVLAYGKATWHLGKIKRVFLKGTMANLIGVTCWVVEELGVLECPAIISLHPMWHVAAAYSLLAWTAFLKYHRGAFLGFKVEIREVCWCPYTIWQEPDNPEDNPIIRHSKTVPKKDNGCSGALNSNGGRRNTFLEPKFTTVETALGGQSIFTRVQTLWRGASFYRASSIIANTLGTGVPATWARASAGSTPAPQCHESTSGSSRSSVCRHGEATRNDLSCSTPANMCSPHNDNKGTWIV